MSKKHEPTLLTRYEAYLLLNSKPSPDPVIHMVIEGEGKTQCCNKSPFDLPRRDQYTTEVMAYTCPGRTERKHRWKGSKH